MARKIKIPEKDFFTKAELLERWKITLNDFDHYVHAQRSLRLAIITQKNPMLMSCMCVRVGSLPMLFKNLNHNFNPLRGGTLLKEIEAELTRSLAVDSKLTQLPVEPLPDAIYIKWEFAYVEHPVSMKLQLPDCCTLFENFAGEDLLVVSAIDSTTNYELNGILLLDNLFSGIVVPREERDRFELCTPIIEQARNLKAAAAMEFPPVDIRCDDSEKILQTKPVARQIAQESAILNAIIEHEINPLELPKSKPGLPGFKSKIRNDLKHNKIFTGRTIFNKAWERLRKSGGIKDRI